MSDLTFAPKEVIEPESHLLEVLSAEIAEQYGPQLALKLKVVGGEHDGHAFTDYPNRDPNTGQVKEGSKAWSIFEACLGQDFYKRGLGLKDLVGRRFVARVAQTKTGSRNKLEHGTIGPVPPEAAEVPSKESSNPSEGGAEEDDFDDIPL
jgi:hypothetical protein